MSRSCVEQCEAKGYIAEISIKHCKFSSDVLTENSSWYEHKPFYSQWKQWNCESDCQYHCMIQREKERETDGFMPVKYHGKWPFKRVYIFQVFLNQSSINILLYFTSCWNCFTGTSFCNSLSVESCDSIQMLVFIPPVTAL